MSPGEQLLLVIALLYLGDCFGWVSRHALLLSAGRVRLPGGTLGNASGSLLFLNPIPGVSPAFELSLTPFSWGEAGVLSWISGAPSSLGRPPQTARFVSWGDLRDVETRGTEIWINGALFVEAGSRSAALSAVDHLLALRGAAAEQRAEVEAKRWDNALDAARLRERQSEALRRAQPCMTAGWLQLFCLFAAAPLLCFRYGLDFGLIASAALILGVALLNMLLYVLAHRRLYPDACGERWKHAVIMVLSFPMSARSADAVLRSLFVGLPGPGVALTLAPEAAEGDALRMWWRDLGHPLAMDELEERDQKLVKEDVARQRGTWQCWLDARGLRGPLEAAVLDWEEGETGFCPRCLNRYLQSDGGCSQCPGVKLSPKGESSHVE